MKNNIADKLIYQIQQKKAPIVVGLDPVLNRIPSVYTEGKPYDYEGASKAILEMNIDIIDAIAELVPAVKPQMAFYEMLGHNGIAAFEQTVQYAKQKGLIAIEDGKRNDIGNTARAYADGHLGQFPFGPKTLASPFDVDYLTVSPFLGPESLEPFVSVAKDNGKGLFILVKTSNPGSGMVQDVKREDGKLVSEALAVLVNSYAGEYCGETGYSPIGAVVGATYPAEALKLRNLMPKSILLVPGYGAQGGGAADVVPNFHDDGLGAIVNASRSILFAYESMGYNIHCSRQEYKNCVREAVQAMRKDIYDTLRASCSQMKY